MHPLRKSMQIGRKLFIVFILSQQQLFFIDGVPACEVDECEPFDFIAEGLVVEDHFLIVKIGQEHFLLEYFADGLMLVTGNDLHPLLEALPFPEHDEEVVFADLIEGLDLLEPLLDGDELGGLGVDELAHSLAAEGVVVSDLLEQYFRVWHHFHVIVVVLIFANHIDELVCSQLLLTHHVEERRHLLVGDLHLCRGGLLGGQQVGGDGLDFDIAWHFD